jgi:hypothetical protein
MALHKESYGLIYNDDGSLCVTLRKDDVPFEGVTSFAVEEGTTNLHPNPEDLNAFNGYPSKWSYKGETYNGMKVFEWTVKDGTRQYIGIDQSSIGNWVGKTVTFSVYYYVQNVPSWGIYIASDATIHKSIVIDLGDGWKRRIITATLNATTCDFWLNPFSSTAGVFKFCGFQIEEKPFATSFTEGTRPAGRFRIFDDASVRRFANGFVIGGWFKRNKPVELSEDFRLFSCTEDGGFNIEKIAGNPMRVSFNDGGTYVLAYLQNQTFLDDLQWHFVILTYDTTTKTAKLYIDGVSDATLTLQNGLYFNQSKQYRLEIGNELYGTYPFNGLISNIIIATYDPAIWTDDYIQALYDAKKPFAVPPKMPII